MSLTLKARSMRRLALQTILATRLEEKTHPFKHMYIHRATIGVIIHVPFRLLHITSS